jgi:hypothetical protein
VLPTMAIVATKVLWIPLPKFHDGDDAVTHIGRLAKLCVTNGENIDAHKLWGKNVKWFTHFETKNISAT